MPEVQAVTKAESDHVKPRAAADSEQPVHETQATEPSPLGSVARPGGAPPDDPIKHSRTVIDRLPSNALRQQFAITLGRHQGNAYLQRVLKPPPPPSAASKATTEFESGNAEEEPDDTSATDGITQLALGSPDDNGSNRGRSQTDVLRIPTTAIGTKTSHALVPLVVQRAPADGGPPPGGTAVAPPPAPDASPAGPAPTTKAPVGSGSTAPPSASPSTAKSGQPDKGPAAPVQTPPTSASSAQGGASDQTSGQTAGQTQANSYKDTLPPDLRQAFEERADPAFKEKFDKLVGGADSARLTANQFSYTQGRIGMALLQTILPYDSIADHWRAMTTDNAYASSASISSLSGWIAGIQTVAEFLRGVTRLAGDLVGGASAGLGTLAIGAAGLALIPPLSAPCGTFALMCATWAEALAVVKAGADMADVWISLAQQLGNILRARLTDDPKERARIAQQIRKESSDMGSSLTSALVGVATLGVGRAFGKLVPKNVAAEVEAAGKITPREFIASIRPEIEPLAVQAGVKPGLQVKGFKWVYGIDLNNIGTFNVSDLQKSIQFGKFNPQAVGLRVMGVGVASGATGQALGLGPTGIKVAGGIGGSGPGSQPAVSQPMAGLSHQRVSYWPSVLEAMGNSREWVHNAQVRMVTQYNNAADDAGDKKKAVAAITGGPMTLGNRIRMTGGVLSAQAEKSQAEAAQMGTVGADASQKRDEVKAKKNELAAKAAQADKLTADAQAKTASAKADEGALSWIVSKLSSGKDWLARGIAWVQSKIAGGVTWLVSSLAGLSDADKALAGIPTEAQQQQQADATTKATAAGAQQSGDAVDSRIQKLKEGLDNQEQNAIQGMADASSWIAVLDAYDQALANQQETGRAYIEQTSKPLADEIKGGQNGVDPAPLIENAKRLNEMASIADATVTELAGQAVDDLPARVHGVIEGVDCSAAVARGHQLVPQIVAKYRDEWAEVGKRADAIAKVVSSFGKNMTTMNLNIMITEIDDYYKALVSSQLRALADVDATLQAICDAIVDKGGSKAPDQAVAPSAPQPATGSSNGSGAKQPEPAHP